MATVCCQERILTFENKEVSKRTRKDSYTISNALNNDLAVIIIERKEIFANLFNSNFKSKGSIKTENVKSKFTKALGYSIVGENFHVLYSNEESNKFALLTLNFTSGEGISKEINIDFGTDMFLNAVNYNNKLYLLSASSTNENSEISIRAFDNNSDFNLVKTFSLNEISEYTSLIGNKMRMGLLVVVGRDYNNTVKIDKRVPNSIEQTSNKNKIFQNDQYVYITCDVNEEATQIYKIDLESLVLEYHSIPYPEGKEKPFKKFNSFFFEDKLFQIASSKEELSFDIKSLDGALIKSFYINKDQAINFKNSPIIQEGQTALPFVTTREMEETSKYLRKVSSGDLGINIYRNNDLYALTLGGFDQIASSLPGLPVMVSETGFNSYNPTFVGYNSYISTRSTYFNSILDVNFNHQKGEVEKNVFDKIEAYKSKNKFITAEDVFFHNNQVFFGYFDLKKGEYNLIKFGN